MKKDIKSTQNNVPTPLFTGEYKRDTAVSEYEKLTEASNFLFSAIKRVFKKKTNKK